MSEIYRFGIDFLQVIIDILTFFLVIGIFYTVGIAIITMTRNQQPRWQNILYILVTLGMGLVLLRYYPPQVMSSIVTALQEARPESDALRDELQYWLPGPPTDLDTSIAIGTGVPVGTVQPQSTVKSLPVPTVVTAQPAALNTPSCTLDINGITYPCPPTPGVQR